MCEAIVKGMLNKSGGNKIIVSEPYESRREYLSKQYPTIAVTSSNADVFQNSRVIVLAVKPQHLSHALSGLKISSGTLVVSICAGVPISRLEELTSNTTSVVRVMPNFPAMVGEGATGFCLNSNCVDSDAEVVKEIFSSVGAVVERVSENLMDVVTGVSGSGPAYVCLLIEAMADAAVVHGMPRDTALRLAAQTCVGAGKLVLAENHPAVLKDKICSPGGTSIAAVAALEEKGFRAAAMAAVTAVVNRSKELAKL